MTNWRSMLFVPAAAPQRWQKAHTRGADALIVDLEDSTQPEAKAARARAGGRCDPAPGGQWRDGDGAGEQ